MGRILIDRLPSLSKMGWTTMPMGMSSRCGTLYRMDVWNGIMKDRAVSFPYTLVRISMRCASADWWLPQSIWWAMSSCRVSSSRFGLSGYLHPFLMMLRMVFQLFRCCQIFVMDSMERNSEPGVRMVLRMLRRVLR